MPDNLPLHHQARSSEEMTAIAAANFSELSRRRTVRDFSDTPVSRTVIEHIVRTAATAPSGAHKQPWHFCVVSDPEIKRQIREAAEKEEYDNYHGRMSEEWLEDLAVFGTDWHKPFLATAPYLIVVFKKAYDVGEDGKRHKNYYVNESVGIACGFLIAAIHRAGLVTVTHTPSPMNFLQKVLGRPENERAYLLLPVGLPAEDARVPAIERKALDKVLTWY
ncbi:nitroreductase [Lewinella aquimaris]|uniref:Nitroreductase n=1 Tax=Neolewinella aquimaris TaxID=1835722 RepID=A0A840E4P1_9BACT|nr:nitroreductase family protein [Neolewinella aquimaris]MBB4080030.1 nitroreductase [Neolewinella aquimaris]